MVPEVYKVAKYEVGGEGKGEGKRDGKKGKSKGKEEEERKA